MSSPANVLCQILADAEIAKRNSPTNLIPFGLSRGLMPQNDGTDEWVTALDSGSTVEGKYHNTGELAEHPHVQFLIRGRKYAEAFAKAKEIRRYFTEGIHDDLPKTVSVTEGGTEYTYLVQNITLLNGPQYIGVDEKNLRLLFSLNFQLTLKEVV